MTFKELFYKAVGELNRNGLDIQTSVVLESPDTCSLHLKNHVDGRIRQMYRTGNLTEDADKMYELMVKNLIKEGIFNLKPVPEEVFKAEYPMKASEAFKVENNNLKRLYL